MYNSFYRWLPVKSKVADGDIGLLSDAEVAFIKRTERITIAVSAGIGALMIPLLHVPKYIWKDFFSDRPMHVPLVDMTIPFNVPGFIFGQVLVFAEVFLLTLLSIYGTHEIGVCTGFIDRDSKGMPDKREFLLRISREKKSKEIHELGINPYLGLSKARIFLTNFLFTLKATVSNFLFRLFLQKVLGRYAFRIVLDLAGMPVFAFWNAMGTRKILKESRVIIMGVNFLQQFEREIKAFRDLSDKEKTILYDTLQYVAVSKRDYHQNHYVLAKILIDRFGIPVEKEHPISPTYAEDVLGADTTFRLFNERIIILGFILDGDISSRERKRFNQLKTAGLIRTGKEALVRIKDSFVYGTGIDVKTN